FQAEDGIRDPLVTGVQTCALPIYLMVATHSKPNRASDAFQLFALCSPRFLVALFEALRPCFCGLFDYLRFHAVQSRARLYPVNRSEERRVGKECSERSTLWCCSMR